RIGQPFARWKKWLGLDLIKSIEHIELKGSTKEIASMRRFRKTLAAVAAAGLTTVAASAVLADTTLLNVSYDPTRQLFKAVHEAFAKDWKKKTGENVTIEQSHGGPGNQAPAGI